MPALPSWAQCRTYLGECLRLLYWGYFKPFTLRRWLRTIDTKLHLISPPFRNRDEFSNNPALARYARQSWWITFIVPPISVLMIALVYSLGSKPFDWQASSLLLLGWSMGLGFGRLGWSPQGVMALYSFSAVALVLSMVNTFAPNTANLIQQFISANPFISLLYTATFSVVAGASFGYLVPASGSIAYAVGAGVAVGVSGASIFLFGGTGSVTGSLILGIVFSLPFSVLVSSVDFLRLSITIWWVLIVLVVTIGGAALGRVETVVFGITLGLGYWRVYFWLPELVWMLVLGQVVPPGQEARALRWLPPRFDEVIHLPLPFMAEFIAKAHRTNPVAAQQTLDYLITSTNQQAVAAQAMAWIAVDKLEECASLQDIAALAEDLAWVPSPPPPQVGPLLPRFIDVSQAVRAALASTSPYRQWESLAAPQRELSQIKAALAQADPAMATTYGGIVERWLGVLKTAQTNLYDLALRSDEIPAVYIAGAALDPDTAGNRFQGRQDLFREIETLALADEPPTLLLYGGRRTGKTSALKYLPQRTGPHLVPLLVDMQGAAMATTLVGTAQFLAQQIQLAARQSRNLTLPAPDLEAIEADPFPSLQRWFAQIEQIARNQRFLLCLDEFERLSEVVNATGSRAPLNFLRYVIQHQRQWIILFSGSHTPDELDPYWSDYLINAQSLRLSYLDAADARTVLQQPIPEFPDIYEPEAVEAILQLTRCQPYFLQLTGLVLVEFLNRLPNRRKATAQDVDTIVPKVLERGGEVLRERFYTLSPAEQTLLHHLANQAPLPPEAQPLLRRLVKREILEPDNGHYRFQVPLFQRYVQSIS